MGTARSRGGRTGCGRAPRHWRATAAGGRAGTAPPPRGVRRREYVYGRDRDEVRAKLNQLLAAEQAAIPVSHERWTVEAYLRYWLEDVVRPTRAPKTHQGTSWRCACTSFRSSARSGWRDCPLKT